jgi:hypothetical protein
MTAEEVAGVLRELGPSTLEEIQEHVGDEAGREEIEAALAEAEEDGQIEQVGETWSLVV